MIAGSDNSDIRVADAAASGPTSGHRAISLKGNQLDSRELFSLDREIVIAHGEERYRLRLTSQNKLILTK